MPEINIDIAVEDPAWNALNPDLSAQIAPLAKAVLDKTPFKNTPCEISLLLTNDVQIQALNKNYRDQDKPTNVLSFPQYAQEEIGTALQPVTLGDIILAYETINREANEHKKPLREHILHLIAHGLLHLLGYDHETDEDAATMEALEIEVLQALNIKNPYEIHRFMQ